MWFLRLTFKVIHILRDGSSTRALAASIVLGMWIGLTPVATMHWFMLLALGIIFRINIASMLLSYISFGLLSTFLGPLYEYVGLRTLSQTPSLFPLWETLYHAPLIPYTRFNHSRVMGSFLISLGLSLPVFFLANFIINRCRENVFEHFRGTRFYQMYIHYQKFLR